ncbi:MAG: Veg family protein [Bacilli bacterium]|nr:Veg family protein [Bacilli bacterium]MBP3921292.1 Veg family protein [Bacilli bacterium]
MTLQEIKSKLNENVGHDVTIRYNLGRNKVEKYKVKIKETYRNVFIVELIDEKKQLKSFSYADVITKTIKIDY